jgi:hypothetical protein
MVDMTNKKDHCLSCECSQTDKPLISLQFKGTPISICPQCLPTLVHHPEDLDEKLKKRVE